MSTRLSREWGRTDLHPRLPGEDLGSFEMGDRVCFYDPEDPGVYIVGDAVEVGTKR